MKKNALKYDLKPQGRPSAKIRQNYKMIKESISSIAFKGYQQIFAEDMHIILIKRGSLKIHMERRGRGGETVGVSLMLNFIKELTGKD